MKTMNAFERVQARRSDPTTSQDAAGALDAFRWAHGRQILSVLKLHPEGLTVYEIASMCAIDAHAVGKRMTDLKGTGEAEVVTDLMGEVKRMTPTGRRARVWRAVVAHIGGVQ